MLTTEEQSEMPTAEEQRVLTSIMLRILLWFIVMLILFAGFIWFLISRIEPIFSEWSEGTLYASAKDVSAVQTELAMLSDNITILQETVDRLSQSPRDLSLSIELAQINSNLISVDSRLQEIEHTILEDPAKALEVTLLRRDIDDMQEEYQRDLQSARAEIARIYDFNKWFLGVVVFGLVGIIVSNFLPDLSKLLRKKPTREAEPDETEQGDTERR